MYATLQFTTPVNFDSVKAYNVVITSTLPNGGTDGNLLNDTATRQIVGLSQVPPRIVLLETFTTAICGYCPELETWLGQMLSTADSSFLVPVCLHAGYGTDAMTTYEADTLANFLDFQGAPSVSVDRELYYGNGGITVTPDNLGYPDNIPALEETEETVVSPVGFTATNTYDPETRALTVTVNSTFYGPVTGDFRMNCYITEDSVVGSGAGYDQHSYYYSSPTSGNPWLNVGSYSASDGYATIAGFVHNHVDRALLNGIWGDSISTGNIPHSPVQGTTYTQTYHYTLSSAWRTKFIKLAAFVSQYNPSSYNSEYNIVWNAVGMNLNVPTGIQQISSNENIVLYPNPAQNVVTLAYTLDNDTKLSFEVYNMLGQMVSSDEASDFSKGSYTTTINTSQFVNGIYFVTVKDDTKVLQTLKFVIAK